MALRIFGGPRGPNWDLPRPSRGQGPHGGHVGRTLAGLTTPRGLILLRPLVMPHETSGGAQISGWPSRETTSYDKRPAGIARLVLSAAWGCAICGGMPDARKVRNPPVP